MRARSSVWRERRTSNPTVVGSNPIVPVHSLRSRARFTPVRSRCSLTGVHRVRSETADAVGFATNHSNRDKTPKTAVSDSKTGIENSSKVGILVIYISIGHYTNLK